MNDEFEDLLKRWLRDRGGTDRSALQALAGNVAALPPRRGRRSSPLAAAAAIILALGLGAIALMPRSGSVSAPSPSPSVPAPPDPAAFAGDPRLALCGATVETALDAFEMAHARDYWLHLPAMGLSPELDVDAPAFVVVYRAMQPFGAGGGAPRPDGQVPSPRSLTPGHHDVCVLVGADPTPAELNVYSDVDTAGLTALIPPGTTGSPPTARPAVTPEPAPEWVLNLSDQLDCAGAIANIGGEVPEVDPLEAFGTTPDAALAAFLGPNNPYASLPAGGFTRLHADVHWAIFGHRYGGRLKAVIVLTDTSVYGPAWTVNGLRACDASEFDPAVPLTFPVTIWTDTAGHRVSTQIIQSNPGPGHCGWESTVFLSVKGALYFRDRNHVMGEWTTTRYDPDARLPAAARDSGYRSGKIQLWLDPGRDAYLVAQSRIERWPRSSDPFIGCA